jgi:hypothetical protein
VVFYLDWLPRVWIHAAKNESDQDWPDPMMSKGEMWCLFHLLSLYLLMVLLKIGEDFDMDKNQFVANSFRCQKIGVMPLVSCNVDSAM